jgi:hypothetical protein
MLVGRAAGKWGAGLKEKKKRERERESFCHFSKNQSNEFKYEFKSKHPKTMHQHECNRETYNSLI